MKVDYIMNIGQLITHLILNSNKSNQEILDIVLQKFESKTTLACVAWYKTKLRKQGLIEKSRSQKYQVQLSADELQELCE